MNDKMNDPEYVTRKVKITPHDYSKENLLATFTPQKQLTPEQIFWSNDLMKLKYEALKERTKEAACAHLEEHVMHDCVQLNYVVESHDDYTSDGNIILCDQYVTDNE
nr:hypothetical protein [Tanacetum cinerariifolium]